MRYATFSLHCAALASVAAVSSAGVRVASVRDPIRAALLAVALVPLLWTTSFAKATTDPSGRELYLEECAPCHGPAGRGDGPEATYFSPPPRDLRTGFLDAYDDEEIVARLRDGTPLMLELDPEGLRARVLQVEQLTAHLQRLPTIDWARVDEGSKIFMERCSICHGAFGKPWPPPFLPEGVQRPPQDLWDPEFQRETSDEELVAAVQHGRGVMPGIPGLQGDEQARKLLPYIRLLSPGFEIYSYYCAVCHGDDGHPEHAMAPDEYRPGVTFDRAWLAKKEPEQLRVDVAHMLTKHGTGMPHFREVFDDDELRSIVKYLKGVKTPGPTPGATP